MAQLVAGDVTEAGQAGGDDLPAAPTGPGRPRRRLWKVLGVLAAVVAVLVVAGAVWYLVGRDEARQRTDAEALESFRADGAGPGEGRAAAGLPAAGVYAATAEGTESVGLPGLDESLGPNAPVTVTHGADGCFTYRTDLNSHHWRSWTFCPAEGTGLALVGTESATLRKFPGIDFGSVHTYTCEQPLVVRWSGQAVGDRREGACTGTADTMEGTTTDAVVLEVLEVGTRQVGDGEVAAVRFRTTDTFGGDQTGTEVAEWWVDAATGLPLRVDFDARIRSETPLGTSDYVDDGSVELTTLTPAT